MKRPSEVGLTSYLSAPALIDEARFSERCSFEPESSTPSIVALRRAPLSASLGRRVERLRDAHPYLARYIGKFTSRGVAYVNGLRLRNIRCRNHFDRLSNR